MYLVYVFVSLFHKVKKKLWENSKRIGVFGFLYLYPVSEILKRDFASYFHKYISNYSTKNWEKLSPCSLENTTNHSGARESVHGQCEWMFYAI